MQSDSLMKFRWEITKAWFLHSRGNRRSRKTQRNKNAFECIREKREAKQNKKEERKKNNREKDYRRLRSDNDNEKEMQNREKWKRKIKRKR